MLHRPPARHRARLRPKPEPGSSAAAKRQRRRLAQLRYRRRFDAGLIVVPVEISGAVVEMLVASRWLDDGETDRKKIALAIAAMLGDAARR